MGTTEAQRTRSFFEERTSLCSLCLCGEILLEDVDDEGGDGDKDGGGGDPEGRGLADSRVLGLDLVGLYIDDVVLLEIVVGRGEEVGIVEVDVVDLLLALGILTDELYVLTDTVDGEIASLGEGLEDVDLLTGYLIATRTVYFTEDRDGVAGHLDRDDGVLGGIEVGLDLVVDHGLALSFGEASDLDATQDGIVDGTFIIDEVGLQNGLRISIARLVVERGGNSQVEGGGSVGVDRVDGDGQDVLGHDLGIVEHA